MPRRELEREQRLDLAGRRGRRIGVDALVRRERGERRALVLDERRGVEDENGHGEETALAATVTRMLAARAAATLHA